MILGRTFDTSERHTCANYRPSNPWAVSCCNSLRLRGGSETVRSFCEGNDGRADWKITAIPWPL